MVEEPTKVEQFVGQSCPIVSWSRESNMGTSSVGLLLSPGLKVFDLFATVFIGMLERFE